MSSEFLIAPEPDRHAAEVSVKFQSDTTILTLNLAAWMPLTEAQG